MKKEKNYTATLRVMGRTFTGKGKTALDSITALKPGNAHGRGILTVSNGTQSRERILMPLNTARIFNSAGFTREVALKNISLIFAGL